MKKRLLIALGIILLVVLLIVGFVLYKNKSNENKENLVEADPTSDKITVDDLKNELGATGSNDIYEVSEEYDGRKILTVKQEIEYKVALAGVLSDEKVTFENLDSIIETTPDSNGIWINARSQSTFLKMISELTDGEYYVDNNGYLSIKSGGDNYYDKAITELINGDRQFFVDIKGSNYIVDPMSGEITENPFEKMEPEQTYEYYESKDLNKIVLILTTNKEKILSNQEIVNSFLDLFM